METRQLEYFISLARHCNFTAAAQEHYVSQPCISHQIKKLEEELGVELLRRSTRSVELTAAGESFLQDAKRAVDLLESAKQKLRQNRNKNLTLHIGYLSSPTRNFLPQVLSLFHARYPDVKVYLHRGDATQVLADARNDSYDVYCSMAEDLKRVPELATKSIQTDHYCLVTPNTHPALNQITIDYAKLASEPFVMMNPTRAATMHRQILKICHELGFEPRIAAVYDVYEDILYAIESGMGIAILPYLTRGHLNSNLAYTLLEASNLSIVLSLGWRRDTDNPAVQMFLDVCRVYLQEHLAKGQADNCL